MWPFNNKVKVLEKPVYRFRGEELILCTLPAGRTSAQAAVWRQEVSCAFIKCNGRDATLGFGLGLGMGINYMRSN